MCYGWRPIRPVQNKKRTDLARFDFSDFLYSAKSIDPQFYLCGSQTYLTELLKIVAEFCLLDIGLCAD